MILPTGGESIQRPFAVWHVAQVPSNIRPDPRSTHIQRFGSLFLRFVSFRNPIHLPVVSLKLPGEEPDGLRGIVTPVVASSRTSDMDAASAAITHRLSGAMAMIADTRMVKLAKGEPVNAAVKLQLCSGQAERDLFVLNSSVDMEKARPSYCGTRRTASRAPFYGRHSKKEPVACRHRPPGR
jgi:hypothetical protein